MGATGAGWVTAVWRRRCGVQTKMLQALQQGGSDTKTRGCRRKVSPAVVKLLQLEPQLHAHLQRQPRSHSESRLSPIGASLKGRSKQPNPAFAWSLVGFHKWKPQEVCHCILTFLYFVLGVSEGQRNRQTQEGPVGSGVGVEKERGQVERQKALKILHRKLNRIKKVLTWNQLPRSRACGMSHLRTVHLTLVIEFLLLAVKRPSATVSTAEKFITANKLSTPHKSVTPQCSRVPELVYRHEAAMFWICQKAWNFSSNQVAQIWGFCWMDCTAEHWQPTWYKTPFSSLGGLLWKSDVCFPNFKGAPTTTTTSPPTIYIFHAM